MECRAELLADCDVFLVRQSKLVGTLRWPVASTTVRLCLLLSSSWSLNTLSSLSLTELCPESFVMLELFRNKGCLGFVWTLTLSKDLEDTLKFSLSLSWFRRSVCPFVPFGNVDLDSLWSSRLCSMKSSWSESMWHFFEIFFLAGGWADRDFLGVGFMLMCRGVPTSVQTLTPAPIMVHFGLLYLFQISHLCSL